MINPSCPKCSSTRTYSHSRTSAKNQRRRCQDCGKTWVLKPEMTLQYSIDLKLCRKLFPKLRWSFRAKGADGIGNDGLIRIRLSAKKIKVSVAGFSFACKGEPEATLKQAVDKLKQFPIVL